MSIDVRTQAPTPLYARFSRRLRGIVIDWVIATAAIFGVVALAATVRNDDLSRAVGYVVIALLLLYEPVLVTLTGGTLGHYFSNLRVVDDRTGGNVSFPKAVGRLLLKSLLGWYSFVILAATRHNQAVHDILTRSTVQIRDVAKARPGQYDTERAEPARGSMPSPLRRFVVTVLYLVLALVAYFLMLGALVVAGVLSKSCANANLCSAAEKMFDAAGDVGALLLIAGVIALGWRGRLPGARWAAWRRHRDMLPPATIC